MVDWLYCIVLNIVKGSSNHSSHSTLQRLIWNLHSTLHTYRADDIPLANVDFKTAALDKLEAKKGIKLSSTQRASIARKNMLSNNDLLLSNDVLTRVVGKAKLQQALSWPTHKSCDVTQLWQWLWLRSSKVTDSDQGQVTVSALVSYFQGYSRKWSWWWSLRHTFWAFLKFWFVYQKFERMVDLVLVFFCTNKVWLVLFSFPCSPSGQPSIPKIFVSACW